MRTDRILALAAALCTFGVGMDRAHALSSAFTYQGRLDQGGFPQSGDCDFQFSLFDALQAGNLVGTALNRTLTLADGLFTVTLDFGATPFVGSDRWLQVAVRCPAGAGNFATLPRQGLTATPYAIFAAAAGTASDVGCTGCVGNADLANGAVTDAKVTGPIAYGKISGGPTSLPPSGPAGGSLAGTYPNPGLAGLAVATANIQDGAVTSTKVANGSLTATDVDTTSLQARVVGTCTSGQAMLAISSTGQVTCGPAGGGVQDVQAGTGLNRAASAGVVTLSLNTNYTDGRYARFGTPNAGTIQIDCNHSFQFAGGGEYIQQACADPYYTVSIFTGFTERMRIRNNGEMMFITHFDLCGNPCGMYVAPDYTSWIYTCFGICIT